MTITPEEAIFQTAGLISPLSNVTLKIRSEERANPIKIPYNEYYNRTVTIHFPSDWTIKTVLNDISFKNQFGFIDGKSIVAGDSLVITQNLTMNKSYEPKEKIVDLLELTGRTSNLWIPAVIFDKKQ